MAALPAPPPGQGLPCPGCGLAALVEVLDQALAEPGPGRLGILEGTCAVLAGRELALDWGEAPPGQALAVAAGLKAARPERVVLALRECGNMDETALAGALAALRRGDAITAVLVHRPDWALAGPRGDKASRPLLDLAGLLAPLEGVAYLARVAVHSKEHRQGAAEALRRALQASARGGGPALVEVLAACPHAWALGPAEAARLMDEQVIPCLPLGKGKEAFGPDKE